MNGDRQRIFSIQIDDRRQRGTLESCFGDISTGGWERGDSGKTKRVGSGRGKRSEVRINGRWLGRRMEGEGEGERKRGDVTQKV